VTIAGRRHSLRHFAVILIALHRISSGLLPTVHVLATAVFGIMEEVVCGHVGNMMKDLATVRSRAAAPRR
jgi:hypothetical protein